MPHPTTTVVRGWTVSWRHRNASPTVRQSTTFLTVSRMVRYWADFYGSQPWNTDLEITQHTETVAARPISVEALPGPGEPSPAPPLPFGAVAANRFYRVHQAGPPVLGTGDDVRACMKWLAEHHGQDPAQLRVLELVRAQYARPVALDEVPE
jgi:hypothetical protein